MAEMALDLYTQLIELAVPVAVIFEFGNIIVSTFLRVAFGGKLWFGAR